MGEIDRGWLDEDLSSEEWEAIEIHKYYLSCNEGRDVGMTFALRHWLQFHATDWRQARLRKEMADQWQEIQKHKWIESEKAGRDLGDRAVFDWISRHAADWRRRRRVHR